MERSGAIKSKIERPIKARLEAAAPTSSDQKHKGAIRNKNKETWRGGQERSRTKSSAPSKRVWRRLLPAGTIKSIKE